MGTTDNVVSIMKIKTKMKVKDENAAGAGLRCNWQLAIGHVEKDGPKRCMKLLSCSCSRSLASEGVDRI